MQALNVLLTLVVGFAAFSIARQFRPPAWDLMQIVGLCLLIVGFSLWSLARVQLGNSFTVTAQARQLVTHGLYSRIRNPIYVFGACVIAGVILLVERPLGLLVFAILIPIQLRRSRKEAAVLEEKFGEDYRRYRASTWF